MKKASMKQVTINISSKEYSSLAKIAKAMNAVGWCGDDNTVSTVIEEFCLGGEIDTEMVMDNLVSSIDTGCSDDAEDQTRREALCEELAKVA